MARKVFEDIRRYYEETIDWEPDIKRQWVEEYLHHLDSLNVHHRTLGSTWKDIHAFSSYQDRTEYTDLSEIPFWEYSVALEWISTHIFYGKRFELNLKNARRFLTHLMEFYRFLVSKKYIDNMTNLEKAYEYIVGEDRLCLVEDIPYTGDEMWTSVLTHRASHPVTFRMYEYWLAVLYFYFDQSWDNLKAEIENTPGAASKRKQLIAFREKLLQVGHLDPSVIVTHDITYDDLDDAKTWLYGT